MSRPVSVNQTRWIARKPEPEVMSDRDEVRVYTRTDFSGVNQSFARRLIEMAGKAGRAIDLGTGPASIPLELCSIEPKWKVLAVDASAGMLGEGRRLTRRAGLDGHIRFLKHNVLELTGMRPFDLVFSNSLLHHLERPLCFWRKVADLVVPDGHIVIQDLRRPANRATADRLIRKHARDADRLLQKLFHQSLLAAFTPEEVREQLALSGLSSLKVEVVSDRHLLVHGKKRTKR